MNKRQPPVSWPPGAGRLQERGYVCLPLYTFHHDDSPEFRVRVQALEYHSWIYLPEEESLRMPEGFIRLDRMQVIEERLLQPMRVALTDDALWFVSEWLRYYLTEEIDGVLLDYRQELLKQLS